MKNDKRIYVEFIIVMVIMVIILWIRYICMELICTISGLILLSFNLYMIYNRIVLMILYCDVASNLLSILIGSVTLSGGITRIRTWSLMEVYSSEKGSGGERKGFSEEGSRT